MERYTQAAPAKINLALDILGPRPDGYHELRMVMQSVSLCDTATLAEAEAGFSLDAGFCPAGEKSLEQQAAEPAMGSGTETESPHPEESGQETQAEPGTPAETEEPAAGPGTGEEPPEGEAQPAAGEIEVPPCPWEVRFYPEAEYAGIVEIWLNGAGSLDN